MKLVQLPHMTKRIIDYAPCQPPERSFPSNSSQKNHRKISNPHKAFTSQITSSGLHSSLLTFVVNYHPPDTCAPCPFAPKVLDIFISKVYSKFCFLYTKPEYEIYRDRRVVENTTSVTNVKSKTCLVQCFQ